MTRTASAINDSMKRLNWKVNAEDIQEFLEVNYLILFYFMLVFFLKKDWQPTVFKVGKSVLKTSLKSWLQMFTESIKGDRDHPDLYLFILVTSSQRSQD